MLIRQAVSAAEASMHKGIKNKAQVTSMSMPCLEALLGLMPPLAVLDYVLMSWHFSAKQSLLVPSVK